MATQLLAVGTTAANSSDLVVTDPVTVSLKGLVDAKAEVLISLKDDAGAYHVVGTLSPPRPALCITAPGTYRFSRVAGSACGVFSA
ncbi:MULTISPECIES: hypothetical protein [unclassified Sinorhizobium]|uniref:hypothetical protein n=1 Tax=unclassified Sinorhizobium TaxID=2613772 RepID=UPI0035256698